MRWGLYQGASVGNSARDAYLRELDRVVLPRFANRIRQRLIENLADPDTLVDYLKAYLMLGEPRRLDKKHLQYLADREWKAPEAAAGGRPSLATHVRSLLESADALRPIPLDQVLIAKARSAIGQASIPRILYGRLQRSYSAENDAGLRLDIKAVGIEQVLKRKSGRSLSEPIPSLYTQDVFKEVTGLGMAPLVKQFAENSWVWGGTTASPADWAKLTAQVTDLYETDYNSTWDALLNDLEIVPLPSVQKYADALGILGGPTSPLTALLKIVVANTSMIPPPADTAAPSLAAKVAARRGSWPMRLSRSSRASRPCRQARPLRSTSSRFICSCRAPLPSGMASSTRFARFGSSSQAWSASGRRQSADDHHGPDVPRPPSCFADERRKSAVAGQRARHPDRSTCRRRRGLGRDNRAREPVCGRGRGEMPGAGGGAVSVRRTDRHAAQRFWRRIWLRRSVRQVLHGKARHAGRQAAASVGLASRLRDAAERYAGAIPTCGPYSPDVFQHRVEDAETPVQRKVVEPRLDGDAILHGPRWSTIRSEAGRPVRQDHHVAGFRKSVERPSPSSSTALADPTRRRVSRARGRCFTSSTRRRENPGRERPT